MMRAGVLALIGICAAFSSNASGGDVARPMLAFGSAPAFPAAASDAIDDGLMFSNGGAFTFLPRYSRRSNNSQRLVVDTDDCGILTSLRDTRSLIVQSAFGGDWGELDEDDPSVQGQILIGRWLSAHPEIAVIAPGIDKWCGEGSLLDDDEDPALQATWQEGRFHEPTASLSRLMTSSIA